MVFTGGEAAVKWTLDDSLAERVGQLVRRKQGGRVVVAVQFIHTCQEGAARVVHQLQHVYKGIKWCTPFVISIIYIVQWTR